MCDSHGMIKYHSIAITAVKYAIFKCLGKKLFLSIFLIEYILFLRNIENILEQ